jgi:hypothetical protein
LIGKKLFSRGKRSKSSGFNQCCQMVYFQTKNTYLGNFFRALDWKMLIYFMTIWNILRTFGEFLWPFGTFCVDLVHFFAVLVSRTKKNLASPDSTFFVAANERKKENRRPIAVKKWNLCGLNSLRKVCRDFQNFP